MVRAWLTGTLLLLSALLLPSAHAATVPLMPRLDELGDTARSCDSGSQLMCPIVSNNFLLIPSATRQSIREKAQAACDQHDAEGCWQLGIVMIVEVAALPEGSGVTSLRKHTLDKAVRLFHDACQSGSAEACRQILLGEGWLSPAAPDKVQLVARMKRLCDINLASACFSLGQALHVGFNHFPLDPGQGRQALVRGCNLGDARACDLVARMLEAHDLAQADWNGAVAFPDLFARACDAGSDAACETLAERYAQEPVVPHGAEHAAKAWETACILADGDACALVAQSLLDGTHAPADPARARSLFVAACPSGPATACFEASSLLLMGDPSVTDLSTARAMLLSGCSKGPDQKCARIGEVEQRLIAAHQPVSARGPVLVMRVAPSYPADMVRKPEHFMSQTQFTVGPDGAVRNCSASGAGTSVNRAICLAVQQFRYVPAIDAHGKTRPMVMHVGFFG